MSGLPEGIRRVYSDADGLLMDQQNLPVGWTSNGIDRFVAIVKTDPVTGGIGNLTAAGRNVITDLLISNKSTLSIAAAGDSITAFGIQVVSNSTMHDIRGYLSHALAIGRGRLALGPVLGMPGSQTDAIVAALDAWLPGVSEKVVVFFPGSNDLLNAALTPATLFAKIMTGIVKIKAAGKIPVLGTILPRGDEIASSPALRLGTNTLLRIARDTGQIVLVDWDHIYQSSDGTIQSGAISYDEVHPYAVGAERMAELLIEPLEPYMPASTSPASWAPLGAVGHRVTNGVLNGTSGALAGGATGVVATGWIGNLNGSGTLVFSKVAADADDKDQTEWQQMIASGSGGICYGALQQQIATGAGDVSICCDVEVISATSHLLDFVLMLRSDAGALPQASHLGSVDNTRFYTPGTRKRFLKTPLITLSAAEAASAWLYIQCSVADGGSATLKVRRVGQKS